MKTVNIHPKRRALIAALFLALVATVPAGATPSWGDPNQPYDQIPGTWETPHVKWASPLAGGRLNVLFLVPYVCAREVVELRQRLDLDYTVIMTAGRETWSQGGYEGGNATPLKGVEADLVLNKLAEQRLGLANRYDVLVIGNVSWEAIPARFRDRILEHVARGAGLVYVSPSRIEERIYAGLTPVSGGVLLTNADARFEARFRAPAAPADRDRIVGAMPLDVLPLKLLSDRAELARLNRYLRKPDNHYTQSPLFLGASTHGQGRIVALDYGDADLYEPQHCSASTLTSLTPRIPYDPVAFDYFHAMLARCVLWSAGRQPACRARIAFKAAPAHGLAEPVDPDVFRSCWRIATSAVCIARSDLQSAQIVVAADVPPGPAQRATAAIQVRDATGAVRFQERRPAPLAPGVEWRATLPLPILPRGTYYADLRMLDAEERVLDFASRSFRIESALQVTEIRTADTAFRPGDTIRGTAAFSQPLLADQQAVVTVKDTWGRIVHAAPIALETNRSGGAFAFAIDHPLSQLHDIFCTVSDADGDIAQASAWISIPDWTFDEFLWAQFTGAVPARDWRGQVMMASMRRFGVDGAFSGLLHGMNVWQCPLFERMHLKNVYYAEHLGQRGTSPDLSVAFGEHCLAEQSRMCRHIADTGELLDPKAFPYRSGWFDANWLNHAFTNRYRHARNFGSPLFVLNSENELTGESQARENSCFCPLCTSNFQQWCRGQFGNDIGALNREWNTAFKAFDEVRGILLPEAAERNQLPRWVDFRHFMRTQVFTQLHVNWVDMIRRQIPDAEGADAALGNFDYSRFRDQVTGRVVSGLSVFGDVQTELHQSFSGDRSYIMGPGNTLRYEPEFESPLTRMRYPWQYLLQGCRGLITGAEIYNMLGGGNYLTADYSEPLPFFRDIGDEIQALRRGIAKLINTATPHRLPVAIVWSPANHYISRLFPFQDNGFSGGPQYNRSVDGGAHEDAMVLLNALRIRPTFIAPEDVCNGRLARDFRAVLLPYSKGMSPAEADAIRDFVRRGGLAIADNEPGICSIHGRVLEERQLQDLFPVFDKLHLQRHGRGAAVYLAGEMNGFAARAEQGGCAGADIVARLLREHAGIVPPVELLNAAGLPRRDTMMRLFDQGSTRIVGLLRSMESRGRETAPTSLILPDKRHLWDLRAKRYCGSGDRFDINLDLEPRCFVLLEANPTHFTIAPAEVTVQPGARLVLNGNVAFDGRRGVANLGQTANIVVLGPDGSELEHYRHNVLFRGRAFTTELPISLSEPAGRYTVIAEHAITGMRAEARFDVVATAVEQTDAKPRPAAPLKVICAGRAVQPPVIDGVLDDVCWRSAEVRGDFGAMGTGEAPRRATTMRAAYDDTHLYFGFEFFWDDPAVLEAGIADIRKQYPDLKPWTWMKQWAYANVYGIEIFLDPGASGRNYVQMLVNAAGQCAGLYKNFHQHFTVGPAVQGLFTGNCWRVEMAYPAVGLKPGQEWGFNVNRNDETYYAIWKQVGAFSQNPKAFGRLVIGDYREWWKAAGGAAASDEWEALMRDGAGMRKWAPDFAALAAFADRERGCLLRYAEHDPPVDRGSFEALYRRQLPFRDAWRRLRGLHAALRL